MNKSLENDNDWEQCETGLLVACSKRAKSAQQKKAALRLGAGVISLLLALGVGVWSANLFGGPKENYFGGIACSEVCQQMPAMMAGKLPQAVVTRIQVHLEKCPQCQEMLAKMQVSQASRDLRQPQLATPRTSISLRVDMLAWTDYSATLPVAITWKSVDE